MLSLLIVELQLENVTHVYEPNKGNKLKEVSNGCGAFKLVELQQWMVKLEPPLEEIYFWGIFQTMNIIL